MILVYSLMHVASGFLLVATTFYAFAAPTPERRRCTLIVAGVLSLLMLTGGFGQMARLGYGFATWLYIKIACWLLLSAMAGIAFKKPQLAGKLTVLTALVILTAVWSVYYKPGYASFVG
ncbi:MAG: hypothetical protein O3A20_03735 [Planctomycetota bacterium]|nr:hypothetical protein [Planctomycetota bacterium]